jgi:hypothetical protein
MTEAGIVSTIIHEDQKRASAATTNFEGFNLFIPLCKLILWKDIEIFIIILFVVQFHHCINKTGRYE